MAYQIYVFDAYGTLFDVHSAAAGLRDQIGPDADRLSDIWRAKQLEYTWVRTLTGAYLDFQILTGQALDFAAAKCGGIKPEVRSALLNSYETLSAYADVKPALESLRASGARTAILSNGTPLMLQKAAAAAGISGLIDHVMSVDRLARYKTVSDVYGMVPEAEGVEPAAVSFQSSNRWDIAGAKKFGFRTVWINRTGQPDEYEDLPADHTVSSLADLPGLNS